MNRAGWALALCDENPAEMAKMGLEEDLETVFEDHTSYEHEEAEKNKYLQNCSSPENTYVDNSRSETRCAYVDANARIAYGEGLVTRGSHLQKISQISFLGIETNSANDKLVQLPKRTSNNTTDPSSPGLSFPQAQDDEITNPPLLFPRPWPQLSVRLGRRSAVKDRLCTNAYPIISNLATPTACDNAVDWPLKTIIVDQDRANYSRLLFLAEFMSPVPTHDALLQVEQTCPWSCPMRRIEPEDWSARLLSCNLSLLTPNQTFPPRTGLELPGGTFALDDDFASPALCVWPKETKSVHPLPSDQFQDEPMPVANALLKPMVFLLPLKLSQLRMGSSGPICGRGLSLTPRETLRVSSLRLSAWVEKMAEMTGPT
ncbi:hypothetical protein ACRALDRAFT_206454 [Sodiomyces alcalophilus JCM 7366]|uniref:uncharacterized protein n=1 Tax=Sodiomyces alcalophilus JCM 7366 TaxID=591952 RepID=UPI0039B461CF